MKNASIEERFWEKVDKNVVGGCWLWTGQTPNGYGRLDTFRPVRATYSAHRLSWKIHFGDIQNGLHVLHKCDVPRCVNPKHLFLGDQRANNKDMFKKGRNPKGTKFPHAKLDEKSVATIRRRFAGQKITQTALAIEYGVARSQIQSVVHRKAWKHV